MTITTGLKNSLLTAVLGLVLTIVLIPFSVHAETNPYILLDSDKGISSVVSDVNNRLKPYDIKLLRVAKDNSQKVFVNKVDYIELDQADKQAVMEEALKAVESSNLAGRDRARFYNFMEEQDEGTASVVRSLSNDVGTDVVAASSIVRPFTSPISVFLGVACLLVFMLLSVSMALDIIFLSIPMFQSFVLRNGQDRPLYISQEAWDSLLIAESSLGSGNVGAGLWGNYLKSRTITLIFIGITLAYLMGGQVFDLASFIVDVFSRAFN